MGWPQAAGVSLLSWSAYLASAFLWFWFEIPKRDRHLPLAMHRLDRSRLCCDCGNFHLPLPWAFRLTDTKR